MDQWNQYMLATRLKVLFTAYTSSVYTHHVNQIYDLSFTEFYHTHYRTRYSDTKILKLTSFLNVLPLVLTKQNTALFPKVKDFFLFKAKPHSGNIYLILTQFLGPTSYCEPTPLSHLHTPSTIVIKPTFVT